ncbi:MULTISPECIES: hypothetical protein [unclassified Sphingomonas]|uniref:hypothetical protein n=1 Tax=unclassified Sphingomonas TaxID=196159 RepID=UPI0007003F03|nr:MULTISPECIES: hypothetical protein [unclassified Sphingomonas]KQM28184.1 hypothetical protein ASE58_07800 [Sphingomonas sp. Leaf9]KQM44526.1 hypothetical protein ASE57_07795 [Sphingomonas sp. Leaf11]
MVRVFLFLAALSALFTAPANAQQNGFDLDGPEVAVSVKRGDVELPVAAVPALRGGDTLTARALLPADQSARYLLIVAFLRGATNPPPKNWFFSVETWKPKKDVLTVTVPEGAEQAILFLAPEAGGGFSAVRGGVRGRPGVFVRAAQDLYQASLDRQRLDAFVGAVGRIGDAAPERLATAAPVLAEALRIKLNADCLLKQRALQAVCLTQQRDALVLQAQRGATLTETVTGAPVDIAYRVAATREGGAGYYSPYIGLARDLARLFGAFRSAQYQYLPALALGQGTAIHLQLNSAPSFQNPRSVLVAPLPPIGDAPPPLWRSSAPGALCLAKPDLVLPLDDAALLFATDYARDLTLKVTAADGKVSLLKLTPDAERGGLVLGGGAGVAGPITDAVVQGSWGFDRFSGPRVPAQIDGPGAWTPQPDANVIVGRDHPLVLRGGASACVSGLTLRDAGGLSRSIGWKAAGADAIEATLPLGKTRPGPLTLTVVRHGAVAPDQIALNGRAEPSRLDRFTVHRGDKDGVLEGARLDQVAALTLGGTRFAAGALTRVGEGDRLTLMADAPLGESGDTTAGVQLRDGRSASVAATVAPARAAMQLLERRVAYDPPAGARPIELPAGLVPTTGALTFSARVMGGLAGAEDGIEIAAGDVTRRLTIASGAVQRVGDDVVVATIAPQAAFGPAVSGELRIRAWRGGAAGDWQKLATLVRLPVLTGIECRDACTVTGRDLFLIAAIGTAPDMAAAVTLPGGFVGTSVSVPRGGDGTLYLRLHDAGDAVLRAK